MTDEVYDNRINEEQCKHEKRLRIIKIDYALSNNSYKIGDIVEDHYQIVKIETIKAVHSFSKYPECVYTGVRLKKNLEPFNSGEESKIWQTRIKKQHHIAP